MTDEERKDLIQKVERLEWTEELRPKHPWHGQLLINKKEVIKLLEQA